MLKNIQSTALYSSNYRTGLAKPYILDSRDWTMMNQWMIFLPLCFFQVCSEAPACTSSCSLKGGAILDLLCRR